MRVETQIKLRSHALERVHSLSWQARDFGLSHEEILSRIDTIMLGLGKAPTHIREYVRGYIQAQRDLWYRESIIWAHESPEGKFYSADKNLPAWALPIDPLYQAGLGAEIAAWYSGAHYWRNGNLFFK